MHLLRFLWADVAFDKFFRNSVDMYVSQILHCAKNVLSIFNLLTARDQRTSFSMVHLGGETTEQNPELYIMPEKCISQFKAETGLGIDRTISDVSLFRARTANLNRMRNSGFEK